MTTENAPDPEQLPASLVDAISRADPGRRAPAPAALDHAVHDQARAHFASRGRSPGVEAAASGNMPAGVIRRIGPVAWAGAVAAAVVAGVLVFVAVDAFRDRSAKMMADLGEAARQPPVLGPGSALEMAWDADQSGRLDVLDLLVLARRQEAGDTAVTPEILADLGRRIVSLEKVALEIGEEAVRLAGLKPADDDGGATGRAG